MKTFFQRTLAVLSLVALPALAHDTWIMPVDFLLAPGQPVAARMSAGEGLKPDAPPRRERLVSVDLVDAVGRKTNTTWSARDKHVDLAFPAPAAGVSCMAVTTMDREIEIKPDVVDAYLAEIHPGPQVLQAWATQRAKGQVWKERYAKDAKTYLRTGDGAAGWPQLQALGQTLEIVPAQDPTRLKKGGTLAVELRHNGRPLPDVARASLVCMMAGADFIKTSTGKESVNATLPVTLTMLRAIRDYDARTGYKVGYKPAGGISKAKDALLYLALMKDELGLPWLQPDLFRFGASSLLGDIERQLEHHLTGRDSASYRHAMG